MAVSSIYDQTIAELLKAQQEKEAFYRKQQEEQAKKLQTQVDNAVQRLESGKQQYTDTYHQNAKSAYQQKQRALRDLPQRLAAQGISGGMSESANIALNNSYSSQLGGYKRDYDAALRGIDQSIGDVCSQYDASLADLNAQTLANIADSKSYYDEQILAQKNAKAQAEEAQRLAEEQRRAEEAARRQTEAARRQEPDYSKYENELNRLVRSGASTSDIASRIYNWNLPSGVKADLANFYGVEREYLNLANNNGKKTYTWSDVPAGTLTAQQFAEKAAYSSSGTVRVTPKNGQAQAFQNYDDYFRYMAEHKDQF